MIPKEANHLLLEREVEEFAAGDVVIFENEIGVMQSEKGMRYIHTTYKVRRRVENA